MDADGQARVRLQVLLCSPAQIVADLTFYFADARSLNDLHEFRARSLYSENDESKYRVFAKRLVAEGWYTGLEEALTAARSLDAEAVEEAYTTFRG